MDVLLGQDFAVAEKDRLYRCLDRVLEHKQELFVHLQQRWKDLFEAEFDLLLYDLTSTYVEGEAEQNPKAKYGYSRDGRPDCKQVVIALVMTPTGFPLAYEVMDGNTSDKTTLKSFLDKIESLYGKARRVWLMDRGIPTEAILQEMRISRQETYYLVGTSRGKVKQYEKKWLELPWRKVRQSVEVKLFAKDGELYGHQSDVSYWLDLENHSSGGQFVLGQPWNWRNRRSSERLRTVAELFPELVDAALDDDGQPARSALEALR
jgi:hypothetical protein